MLPADVTSGIWRFFLPGGPILCDLLRMLPDGGITGYDNDDVRTWRLDDGILCFVDAQGEVTTRFTHDATRNGILTLQGRSLRDPAATHYVQRRDWTTRQAHKDETRLVLAAEIEALGWEVGAHTYGRPLVFERAARLVIGRFTSIAIGAQIALGNHRLDTVSLYPFATLRHAWPGAPVGAVDHDTRGDVRIGSDVWLGASCFIGSGVTVGDGAAVSAHAVVLDDVPPYAVVVGNPARIVRMRLPPQQIDRLLRIAWWDWPDEKIDRFLPLILSPNIPAFIRAARGEA